MTTPVRAEPGCRASAAGQASLRRVQLAVSQLRCLFSQPFLHLPAAQQSGPFWTSFLSAMYPRCAALRCRAGVAQFQNTELCRLTEQVIFTDPYHAAPVNRHTGPFLDAAAAAMREDVQAKQAAARLKVGLAFGIVSAPTWASVAAAIACMRQNLQAKKAVTARAEVRKLGLSSTCWWQVAACLRLPEGPRPTLLAGPVHRARPGAAARRRAHGQLHGHPGHHLRDRRRVRVLRPHRFRRVQDAGQPAYRAVRLAWPGDRPGAATRAARLDPAGGTLFQGPAPLALHGLASHMHEQRCSGRCRWRCLLPGAGRAQMGSADVWPGLPAQRRCSTPATASAWLPAAGA